MIPRRVFCYKGNEVSYITKKSRNILRYSGTGSLCSRGTTRVTGELLLLCSCHSALNACHVPTYYCFNRSAPECSLLSPSLHQRSQSVTPNSCQVSENRVSFFAFSKFMILIVAHLKVHCKVFFRFLSNFFPLIDEGASTW